MSEWCIFLESMVSKRYVRNFVRRNPCICKRIRRVWTTAMIAGNIAGETRTLPFAVYSAVSAGNMEEAYQYVWILVIISFLVVTGMNAVTHGFQKFSRGSTDERIRSEFEKKLKNFPLHIQFQAEGGCIGILGASGCGKSMTFKAIAGIETPDSGKNLPRKRELFHRGHKVNLPPRKRSVGYLFQSYALFPNMTVFQNIEAGIQEKRRRKESGQWK